MTATDLATAIRARRVSAVEATRSALTRMDAVNPALNAVVDARHDAAMTEAAAIDRCIANKEDAGLLAGVPITVKINTDMAGYATTRTPQPSRLHKKTSPSS